MHWLGLLRGVTIYRQLFSPLCVIYSICEIHDWWSTSSLHAGLQPAVGSVEEHSFCMRETVSPVHTVSSIILFFFNVFLNSEQLWCINDKTFSIYEFMIFCTYTVIVHRLWSQSVFQLDFLCSSLLLSSFCPLMSFFVHIAAGQTKLQTSGYLSVSEHLICVSCQSLVCELLSWCQNVPCITWRWWQW